MRHRVAGRKLSRHTQHRELMFRNMLVSLLQHERIRTTLAKGKELRRWADRMISLGKKGTLHARRRAFALLRDKGTVKKLFDEIAPKFKDRPGGYTRVFKLGWRQGDAAPLSLVELVTFAHPEEKKKSTLMKAKEVLEKVTPKKKEKGEKKEKGKEKVKEKPKEKSKEKPTEKREKKAKKEEKEAPKEKKAKPKKKSSEEKSK
ncbi:MAG TPA: 50S ribosomal protein L17 [Thermodesulfobacteriota bacterium]|nr:50S ribosomal protein L17 [Thermodesulfobacteriota bacterium]